MAGFPRLRFLAIAMIFHLAYILSVFDIYFVSPIVTGMSLFRIERTREPPPIDWFCSLVGASLLRDTSHSGARETDKILQGMVCAQTRHSSLTPSPTPSPTRILSPDL